MGDNEKFLSDSVQSSYRKHAADCIFEYGNYINILVRWLEQNGFQVQPACRNNLKDAWLHYRKLYEQRQYTVVVQDMYAMEEHLNRAMKDAIVYFFQKYLILLEHLYKQKKTENEIFSCYTKESFEQMQSEYGVDISDDKWLIKLSSKDEGNDEKEKEKIRQLIIYIYWYHIYNEELLAELQNIIHKIKEFCLKLRFDGAKIYRPDSADEYMELCIKLHRELMDAISKYRIKHLIRRVKYIWDEKNGC